MSRASLSNGVCAMEWNFLVVIYGRVETAAATSRYIYRRDICTVEYCAEDVVVYMNRLRNIDDSMPAAARETMAQTEAAG